jgi:hypothetical protein
MTKLDRRPYNQLAFCENDLQYDPSPEGEDNTMLYRPLFWTVGRSFLLYHRPIVKLPITPCRATGVKIGFITPLTVADPNAC